MTNLKRYKILKLLFEQYSLYNSDHNHNYYVTCDEVIKNFKFTNIEFDAIISLLKSNDEVEFYNVNGIKAILITDNGILAFNTRKYLKIYQKSIKDGVMYFVQTFIPVLSMIIALIAVSNTRNQKIDMLEIKLQKMEIDLKNIYKNQYDNQLHKSNANIDSVKFIDF